MAAYTLIPFHRYRHPNLDLSGDIVVSSGDPGLANFATRVELRRNFQPLPHSPLYENTSFGGKAATRAHSENKQNVVRLWGDVLDYIDNRAAVFDRVNLYLFEKQVSPNHAVGLVTQHFKSCLMQRYRDRPPYPIMVEVSPRLKSRLLKADSPGAKGKELKNVSVRVARRLLEERGDDESLGVLAEAKKKDDLSDVVVQLEAFFKALAAEGCQEVAAAE